MTRAMAPVRNSLVQVRIGNRIYDAVRVPQCHTCTHPARMEIETQIVECVAYRVIAEQYSEVEYRDPAGNTQVLPAISHDSIRNHFLKGHLPMQAAVRRQFAERRMQEIGYDLETIGGKFVDQITFNQAVLQRAHERLVAGDIEVEAKDGLAAAKFLAEAEKQAGGGIDNEAWAQAMEVYLQAAQAVMNPSQWIQFVSSVRTNPVLKAIEARLSTQPPTETVSAAREPYQE